MSWEAVGKDRTGLVVVEKIGYLSAKMKMTQKTTMTMAYIQILKLSRNEILKLD